MDSTNFQNFWAGCGSGLRNSFRKIKIHYFLYSPSSSFGKDLSSFKCSCRYLPLPIVVLQVRYLPSSSYFSLAVWAKDIFWHSGFVTTFLRFLLFLSTLCDNQYLQFVTIPRLQQLFSSVHLIIIKQIQFCRPIYFAKMFIKSNFLFLKTFKIHTSCQQPV